MISITISTLLFLFSDSIIQKLSLCLNEKKISISEEDLVNYLSNPSIKFYISHEKNDLEIKEKCKEFIENNINNNRNRFDQMGFITVFKNLLTQDETLRNLIYESEKFMVDLKICIFVNLIQIIFLICFVVSFFILLHSIKVRFGVLKILTTIISILFIVSVMVVCFKIIFHFDKNKPENKDKIPKNVENDN